MQTSVPIAITRRLLLITVAALTALLMSAAATPATAQADVLWPPSSTVSAKHTGWVKVRPRTAYEVCGFVGPCGVGAYQWTGQAWKSTLIGWNSQVYAYPYSGGWHWIWTQRTGWLAIQTSELRPWEFVAHRCDLGYRC